jgi:antitoxin (DNA-binding transcriptional repressor) of toxin-antitoxin stability system
VKTFCIREAKANLSRLIKKACLGEEIVIARGKVPIVRLVSVRGRNFGPRKIGILRGKLLVGPEFFEPLSPEELKGWG